MSTAVTVTMVLAAALVLVPSTAAVAVPPSNDDIAGATAITSLPQTITEDASEATGSRRDGKCVSGASVWFRFAPAADTRVNLWTAGSDYDTILAVFAGPRRARQLVACNDDAVELDSAVHLKAAGGTRYWIAVSACCQRNATAGHLRLDVTSRTPALVGTISVTTAQTGGTSGDLLVSGTAECNQLSLVYVSISARQRVDPGIAHGASDGYVETCTPGTAVSWQSTVESYTGWAFQPGGRVLLSGSTALVRPRQWHQADYRVILPTTDNPDARPQR